MKNNIAYLFHQGALNFKRNKTMSVAAIIILVSCMVVSGTFFCSVDLLNINFSKAESLYVVSVYLESDTDAESEQLITHEIGLLPGVVKTKFISKDEGLENLKENSPALSDVLDNYYKDIIKTLSAKIDVTFDNYENLATLEYKLSTITGVEKVVSKKDLYEGVSKIKMLLSVVCYWLMAVLLIVDIAVIVNMIKITIYNRQQEISVLRYIGATNGFITMPFVTECLITGLVSAFIAIIAQYFIYTYMIVPFAIDYSAVNVGGFMSDYFVILSGMFIGLGVLTASISSIISIKRYLKA